MQTGGYWEVYMMLRHTGRMPCDSGGRDGSDGATSQRILRVASNHQKWGKRHGTHPSPETQEGTNLQIPALSISGPLNSERISSCCLSHPVCGHFFCWPWETSTPSMNGQSQPSCQMSPWNSVFKGPLSFLSLNDEEVRCIYGGTAKVGILASSVLCLRSIVTREKEQPITHWLKE